MDRFRLSNQCIIKCAASTFKVQEIKRIVAVSGQSWSLDRNRRDCCAAWFRSYWSSWLRPPPHSLGSLLVMTVREVKTTKGQKCQEPAAQHQGKSVRHPWKRCPQTTIEKELQMTVERSLYNWPLKGASVNEHWKEPVETNVERSQCKRPLKGARVNDCWKDSLNWPLKGASNDHWKKPQWPLKGVMSKCSVVHSFIRSAW